MEETPEERQHMNNPTKIFADSPVARPGYTPEKMFSYLQNHSEYPGLIESYQTVVAVANHVAAKNGRLFLVGGAVRDELLDTVPKDFDLEVHGLDVQSLESVLSTFGVEQSTGKSFGTYKFPSSSGKIEVALPRQDSQMGDAHNAVEVAINPNLGLTEAARRREFTIGAIYKDVLTGEIYDPFHGIDDLESKTLRMVDATTFGDDALRVLRGAATAARFGLTIDPETVQVMCTMVEKMGALPKERLREEWTKLLVQGKQPSLGLELLREVGVLERWYPEIAHLWSTSQNEEHHPEGNVGIHTLMVTDAAAVQSGQKNFSAHESTELMFAAVLHDTGKPATTQNKDGKIHAIGHEAAGVKPATIFLERLGMSPVRIERITTLIEMHMRPAALYRDREKITDRALKKISQEVGPTHLRTLVALAGADHQGRGPFVQADGSYSFRDTRYYQAWWDAQIERLGLDQAPEQILWGRDLVENSRGWLPGVHIGTIVRLAEELAIQGMTREAVLEIIDRTANPTEAIAELQLHLTAEE